MAPRLESRRRHRGPDRLSERPRYRRRFEPCVPAVQRAGQLRSCVMDEAAWRRRFRALRVSLPRWAKDRPDRLLYSTNESGKWELHAWDLATGLRRQVTDRPEGTLGGALDPSGDQIWWFEDERGSELGVWRVEPFHGGGEARPAAPGIEPAYGAGLALGHGFAVIGRANRGRERE